MSVAYESASKFMTKLTKIKYFVWYKIAANLSKNLPKYVMAAGIINMTLTPLQSAANAQIAWQKPALLAMARTLPLRGLAINGQADEPADFAILFGSALAGKTNPAQPHTQPDQDQKTVQPAPVKTSASAKALAVKPAVKPAIAQDRAAPGLKEIRKSIIVTAYSSTPDQTDSSPFITAMGSYVRDGIVAANFLKFGTKIRLPEIYGEKIFVVEDRMAKKNSHKVDVWMESRSVALQFGVKRLTLEILE